MAYRDPERQRAYEAEKKRRQRARRKAQGVERRRRAARALTLEERVMRGELAAMRLVHPIEGAGWGFQAGEIIYVLPGTVHMLERAHFAVEETRGPAVTGARMIPASGHGLEGAGFDSDDEPEEGTERTAAGY